MRAEKNSELQKRLSRYRALIIRKNADDLKDWIDRAQYLYSQMFGQFVQFTGKPAEIKFGENGPIFRTGHLKDENAYQKYQGHEYQRILIEELTQIPELGNYLDLTSSCRSTIDIQPQVFATTNPDGPGFWWVKDRFHIPEWPPQEPVVTKDEIAMPDGSKRETDRVFISALLQDNPKLKDKDIGYDARIASMGQERVKAWLLGYWGAPIIEGVIFNDEIKRAQSEKRITEVPYDSRYPVYTYWDIGRDATPIIFVQFVGHAIHIIDFYENSGKGFDHYAQVLRDKSRDLHYWYGQHFGPHDLMKTDMQNETIWQIAEKQNILFTIVPKAETMDGIEAARIKFSRFKIDSQKCAEYLKRISAFRREWDDNTQTFRDKYVHDWASHAGTATFYLGLQPDPVYSEIEPNFELYKSNFG